MNPEIHLFPPTSGSRKSSWPPSKRRLMSFCFLFLPGCIGFLAEIGATETNTRYRMLAAAGLCLMAASYFVGSPRGK
jgi:hypothetical protein